MDWLFDNLGKFAPVVFFLLYMISSLKGKGQKEEEEPDPAAAERARKIQEEIRRKILERQRGDDPDARPPEPLVFEEVQEEVYTAPRPVASAPRPIVQEPVAAESTQQRVDSYEQRRREIELKLEESKRLQLAAKEKARSIRKKTPLTTSEWTAISDAEIRTRLKNGLSDRDSLKTAILLREVLGSPIGMR